MIFLVAQSARCFDLDHIKELLYRKCKGTPEELCELPVFDPLPQANDTSYILVKKFEDQS